MEFIPWTGKLSVNVVEIDEQHKQLVQMINDLHDAMKRGLKRRDVSMVLTGLIEYAATHFATEEKFMVAYNYPDYIEHKEDHDSFSTKVLEFQKDFEAGKIISLTMELMHFLKEWLESHLIEKDQRFYPFFNEKGVT